jgi:hypothetical protein
MALLTLLLVTRCCQSCDGSRRVPYKPLGCWVRSQHTGNNQPRIPEHHKQVPPPLSQVGWVSRGHSLDIAGSVAVATPARWTMQCQAPRRISRHIVTSILWPLHTMGWSGTAGRSWRHRIPLGRPKAFAIGLGNAACCSQKQHLADIGGMSKKKDASQQSALRSRACA